MFKPDKITMTLAAAILLLEVIIWILMPNPQPDPTTAQVVTENMSYVPYMFAMLTLSFLSGLSLFIGSILWILKGILRERVFAICLFTVAFLLPITVYYNFI